MMLSLDCIKPGSFLSFEGAAASPSPQTSAPKSESPQEPSINIQKVEFISAGSSTLNGSSGVSGTKPDDTVYTSPFHDTEERSWAKGKVQKS